MIETNKVARLKMAISKNQVKTRVVINYSTMGLEAGRSTWSTTSPRFITNGDPKDMKNMVGALSANLK